MPDPIDTDDLRRMHAARIGPHVTCPASRHAAMIAEDMMTLDETPIDTEHAGASIAATVAALWEARAELSALRAREAEMRAALHGLLSDCDLAVHRPEVIAARAALSQPDSGEGADHG